ncbi:MAG: Ig-like domain-containing protein [Patescibacteria group bacterium]|jgi:hypothetical protein
MLKSVKKIIIFLSLVIVVFAVVHFALAADLNVGLDNAAGTGLGDTDPRIIAARIIRIFLGFLGIIAVSLVMYAGWMYMTAEGDSEKVEKAKKILVGALIGLVICLASFAIASFILNSLLDATGASNNNSGGGGGTITPGGGIPNLPGEGEPCLTNPLDTQCAAGQCAAGLNCSQSDCLCKKTNQPGEGESCDGDTAADGCQAIDCASNLICSSSDNCTCIKTPLIAWVSPMDASSTPNGAVGNFITIGGRYFGTTTGQVVFMGDPNNANDDKVATFPNLINPLCLSFWQDDQIIVVVPDGAVNGPIKVIDSKNRYDTTDDNRGARINDFVVNSIKRPGLCQVDPSSGGLADPFNLQGNSFNLTPHSVLFGKETSAIEANNIKNWTNTSVDAAVPNIVDGRNSVFVKTGDVYSNSLSFSVVNKTDTNPVIEYIEPDKGPSGQYITIYGRNFQIYNAQKSAVKFYLPADPSNKINADIDFPEACKSTWWHDTYIVVKVPKVNSLGDYKVEVTNSYDKTSLPADFVINNETPTPGLCALDPNNGPIGWPMSAYGERFGATQGSGRAQYFNNKDAIASSWADGRVNTNVPLESVSGPFRIIDNQGYISNSLPFRVGKCTANSECDSSEECCGGGTYWSGICRKTGTCAQGGPTGCAFGWTFSTKAGDCAITQQKCDIPNPPAGSTITFNCCAQGQCNAYTGQCDSCPPNKPDQCDGDLKCCSTGGCIDLDNDGKTECSDGEACSSYGLSQCSSSYFCPNSPGKCSTYGGGGTIETGDCDFSCNNFSACKTDLCEYRSGINKCIKKSQTCSLSKTVSYNVGLTPGTATAECTAYDGGNRWIMKISSSCPPGWTSITGGRCVENNTTCSICDTGFKCLKETASAVDGGCFIDQNVCQVGSVCGSSNKCTKSDSASCECCCRIGYDSEDCCSPLKCEGKCGSDITANTNTYGRCSGCASVGTTQAEHNEACNCSGTSGKFCLVDVANPSGVCQDCAQISDAALCSNQGVGTCCVDAKNKNACRGGTAPYASGSPSYNYCGYYECSNGRCSETPVATSTVLTYKTATECSNKCTVPPYFGNTCFSSATTTQSCDINKCTGFACINADGTGPAAPSCGTCCCDPFATTDNCKNINPNLACKANQAPCSGGSRGLCCGCTADSDCGSVNGCGTDTCCHARPTVIEETMMPADGATNVCRNGLIKATFDQAMQAETFKENVIVVGDYGLDKCPTGTKYLTEAYKPGLFEKLTYWLARLPLLDKIFINQAKALTGNFCAVTGSISGYAAAGNTTVMEFKIKKALEANRKYYVIIKGDSNLNDAIAVGVLSESGVGLGQATTESFNGVDFTGKIWSFTTKESNATDNGICLVSSLMIDPLSYLFNTATNDSADDNIGADYDTIRDSDKVFHASAYSPEKQPIIPIEDLYNWQWNWNIDNKSVVKFKNGENALDNNPNQTLVAQNVKEANTLLHAKLTITQDQVNTKSTVGQSKEKTAPVYVFLCANPWPPYKTDGSWEPWRDTTDNCTATTGNCSGSNFEIYYCRDAGGEGTADDLPAVLSDKAVIRGSSANQNILKEFYFFRESTPNVTGVNLTTTINDEVQQGGKAGLVWQAVTIPSGEVLDKYLVYYSTKSGNYEQSISAAQPGTVSSPLIISNLTNGVKYYFAVTAKYKSGAESSYSNEANFTPADNWAPQTPLGLIGEAGQTKATISWQANNDDTKIYKIYYGATSGSLGASVNLEKSKCSATTGKCTLTISDLATGTTYYFAATALDLKGNESNKSAEINLIIL